MSPGNGKGRPRQGDPNPSNVQNLYSADDTPTLRQQDSRQADHARQVRGTLVVVVETPGGKYRRRAFLTLASAERAVRRAEDAGHTASVVLARLEPVAGWSQ